MRHESRDEFSHLTFIGELRVDRLDGDSAVAPARVNDRAITPEFDRRARPSASCSDDLSAPRSLVRSFTGNPVPFDGIVTITVPSRPSNVHILPAPLGNRYERTVAATTLQPRTRATSCASSKAHGSVAPEAKPKTSGSNKADTLKNLDAANHPR
jgi:hypothetical protein